MCRAPMLRARSNAANVFSGAYDEAPRCAIAMKLESVIAVSLPLRSGRTPMVFDVGCVFRQRAEPEPDGSEPLRFVEPARGMVFLVRVQLQTFGVQTLGKQDEAGPP